MKTLRVDVTGATYPVLIEEGIVDRLGGLVRERLERDTAVVIIDQKVSELHGKRVRRGLRESGLRLGKWIELPRGERSKSLARARTLYEELVRFGADRWTPVVAIGGGVVGDLAGFVASTFMRGVPLVHVPSTVVAQVDSSVGGKTAVNFAGAKNLIGTFYQPRMVVCDPALLQTLPNRDYRAGLAEAVKIGVTLRPDLMEHMEANVPGIEARDLETLVQIVFRCLEAKADVVARDEKDQDVRSILNYGHTVGHAVESASLGRIRHGEAVAVGMNAAAWVGETLGATEGGVRERQNALLSALGLKLTLNGADKNLIVRNLQLDKKVRARRTRFVLTLQIGGASVWPDISARMLRDAVRSVTS